MNTSDEEISRDQPGKYKIRIRGRLDQRWSKCLCDMKITTIEISCRCQDTFLTGELVDQAALMGVLNAVYNLGYPLLSVERSDDP
jgi:hypothetical protein